MHPDGEPAIRHAGEDRLVLRLVEGPAVDVGEDLHAGGAEMVDGALQLGQRGVGIVHGQRGDEGGETVGVALHDGRHLVVGDPRQVGARGGRGDHLDGWVGKGEDLDVALPAIHHREAQVEVHEHGDPRHALLQREPRRRHGEQPLEVLPRQDVREDVDLHRVAVPVIARRASPGRGRASRSGGSTARRCPREASAAPSRRWTSSPGRRPPTSGTSSPSAGSRWRT